VRPYALIPKSDFRILKYSPRSIYFVATASAFWSLVETTDFLELRFQIRGTHAEILQSNHMFPNKFVAFPASPIRVIISLPLPGTSLALQWRGDCKSAPQSTMKHPDQLLWEEP
jgi:hypothetical protein